MYHGRKRQPKVIPTEEQKKQNAEMLQKIQKINTELLQRRVSRQYTEANLELTEKAGALFNDNYTVWNFRRELINELILKPTEKPISAKYEFIINELKYLLKLMMKSPKSYPLWFHRGWCIQNGLELDKEALSKGTEILKNELELCQKLLAQDGRNFHAWNYKSSLLEIEVSNVEKKYKENPDEKNKHLQEIYNREYNYTTTMISKDFSNYSTWFYRSKILPFLFNDPTYLISIEKIKTELDMLKQALYTEPKDQSCWNHHRWLVSLILPLQIISLSQTADISDPKLIKIHIGLSHKIKNFEGLIIYLNGIKSDFKTEPKIPGVHSDHWIISIPADITKINEIVIQLQKDAKCPTIEGPRIIRPISIKYAKNLGSEKMYLQKTFGELDLKAEKNIDEILNSEISVLTELIEVEEGLLFAIERLCELYSLKRDYKGNPYYYNEKCNPFECQKEITENYAKLCELKKGTAAEIMYKDLLEKYKQISKLYEFSQKKMLIQNSEKFGEYEICKKNIDLLSYLIICEEN